MTKQTTGSYRITSWEEKTWDDQPWNEVPGRKVTRSIVTQTFTGGIEGEAICQQLVAYSSDTFASFVGIHTVTGSLDAHKGSFMLQATGTYEDGVVHVHWSVVPGSGTDALVGLSGTGNYTATHADYPNVPYTFSYTIDSIT